MSLYLNSRKAWMPPTKERMLHYWAAVQVPSDQKEISTRQDYLKLLAQRIVWMIQQEADQAAALETIRYYLEVGRMDHQIWVLSQLNDNLEEWGQALTEGNPALQEKLSYLGAFSFPSPATEDPEALEIIEQTSLEDWLELMTSEPREGWE